MLAIAPTPAAAAKLSVSRIAAALRRAGRSRGIEQAAAEIKAGLRKLQLRQPLLVESAMGKHTRWPCSPHSTPLASMWTSWARRRRSCFNSIPTTRNQTAVIGRVTETTRSLTGRPFSAEAGRLQQP